MPEWLTLSSTAVTALGAIVTAIATVFLVKVTRELALATDRMADASARPQIVATIEPNQWAMNHADIVVVNSGNATAFDITIDFDPPLYSEHSDYKDKILPFREISVLNPNQRLVSHLSEFAPLLNKKFGAKISWTRHPSSKVRDSLSYSISTYFEGVSRLGGEPAIQIAEQIKNFREDWKSVSRGNQRIHVDVFSSQDREEEQRQITERHSKFQRSKSSDLPDP